MYDTVTDINNQTITQRTCIDSIDSNDDDDDDVDI